MTKIAGGKPLDYFLARQPIFKRNLTVYAYELLFRSNPKENSYTPESSESILNVDGYDSDDQSTSKVLINSYLAEDFESFSQGKKVFINFTEHLIMDETPLIFPNETLVIELLETIKPNQVLVEKCSNLKKKGYTLALDDYVHERDKGNPLLELVDVLKVDFLDNTKKEISQIARLYKNRPFELLAEKVESDEMFQFAKEEGFHYFQGYFFSKPTMVSGKSLHSDNKSFILILNELYRADPDFDKISNIIQSDVSLSYKLLRLVNSAAYYKTVEIKSIKQATLMLGIKKLKNWTLLLMLVDAGKNKPAELVRTSIIRGYLLESISKHTPYRNMSSEFFLMGLFSMIGVIMDSPIGELLKDLPLSDFVKAALMGQDNPYKKIYDIVLLYEKADFEKVYQFTSEMNIPSEVIFKYYRDSITFAHEVFESQS